MELEQATLQQLLDELYTRARWVAIALCGFDETVVIVCEGENGFEILGGIAVLQESQLAAVKHRLFPRN